MRAYPAARRAVPLLAVALLVSSCGGAKRPELSPERVADRHRRYLGTVRAERAELMRIAGDRMVREHQAYLESGGEVPVRDVLILSGGGQKGAFGTGFLHGWGEIGGGPFARPRFDVVTGVSTGALIAPFAFVGTDEAYRTVYEAYRDPAEDWFKRRGVFFFVPGRPSFFKAPGLWEELRETVDRKLVEAIAAGASEDRVLAVAATNLDQGLMRVWNISSEARAAAVSGSGERIHSMLMASAAVPAALPPVEIDGDLYVDGGATEQMFVVADRYWLWGSLQQWNERFPDTPHPKIRVWLVINARLYVQPGVVQPRWPTITARSLDTMTRSSLVSTLRRVETAVHLLRESGIDAEFRFVAIPDDFEFTEDDLLDPELMVELSDLGRRLGADPASWRTRIPDIVWPD